MPSNKIQTAFNVYRGLQRPLLFKGLKGKYIYIGGACIVIAIIACAIVSTILSFMWGGLTLCAVMFGGLGVVTQLQKKGLHNKNKRIGTYIVTKIFSNY